jgi:hypothetical protein
MSRHPKQNNLRGENHRLLLFAEEFARLGAKNPLPDSLEALSTTNVVLLATMTQTAEQSYRRCKFCCGVSPPALKTKDAGQRATQGAEN